MFNVHFPKKHKRLKIRLLALSALLCAAFSAGVYADEAAYCHFQLKSSGTPDTYEFSKIHKLSFGESVIRVHLHENGEVIEYPFDDFAGTTFTTPTSAISEIAAEESGISYTYDPVTGELAVKAGEAIGEILVVNLSGQVYAAFHPGEEECTVTIPESIARQAYVVKIAAKQHIKIVKIIR